MTIHPWKSDIKRSAIAYFCKRYNADADTSQWVHIRQRVAMMGNINNPHTWYIAMMADKHGTF
jgi:hypothetical protein